MQTFELVLSNITNTVDLIVKDNNKTIYKFTGSVKMISISKNNRITELSGEIEKSIQISNIQKGDGLMITKK